MGAFPGNTTWIGCESISGHQTDRRSHTFTPRGNFASPIHLSTSLFISFLGWEPENTDETHMDMKENTQIVAQAREHWSSEVAMLPTHL